MGKANPSVVERFLAAFDDLCDALHCAIGSGPGNGMLEVLARELDKNPSAPAKALREVWRLESGETPDAFVIRAASVLRSRMGPEWHILYEANNHRENGDDIDSRIEYCRDYWRDVSASNELDRNQEVAAARRWMRRQLRQGV